MKIELSKKEVALCVASLENAANDLRAGMESARRMGRSHELTNAEQMAIAMDVLRVRLNHEDAA